MEELILSLSINDIKNSSDFIIGKKFGEYKSIYLDFIIKKINISIIENREDYYELEIIFENETVFHEEVKREFVSHLYTNNEKIYEKFYLDNLEEQEQEDDAEEKAENMELIPKGI